VYTSCILGAPYAFLKKFSYLQKKRRNRHALEGNEAPLWGSKSDFCYSLFWMLKDPGFSTSRVFKILHLVALSVSLGMRPFLHLQYT
jgi:hypothetical protein